MTNNHTAARVQALSCDNTTWPQDLLKHSTHFTTLCQMFASFLLICRYFTSTSQAFADLICSVLLLCRRLNIWPAPRSEHKECSLEECFPLALLQPYLFQPAHVLCNCGKGQWWEMVCPITSHNCFVYSTPEHFCKTAKRGGEEIEILHFCFMGACPCHIQSFFPPVLWSDS